MSKDQNLNIDSQIGTTSSSIGSLDLQDSDSTNQENQSTQFTLLNPSITYKPFRYPWAYEAWKQQQRMHWTADEVPMADDIRDWKHNLTLTEQNLCTQIFRFFTQADIEVHDCYMSKYSSVPKPIEIGMMLSAFQNMETVHIDGYSAVVDTLGMPDEIYEEFLQYKAMMDKHNYLKGFNAKSMRSLALTMGVYGSFIEGVQLFASFAILLNFQRFGKMKGMGQIITWSVRDETLHTVCIGGRLFRTFVEENPEIWTRDFREELYQACDKCVYFEDQFIDLAFEMNNKIEGLSAEEVKLYIRYIADRRLAQMMLKPKYLIQKNPLPWIDHALGGLELTNFFENRSTEYTRGGTVGTWEEAFSIHK